MKRLQFAAMAVILGTLPLSPALAQSIPSSDEIPSTPQCLTGYPDGTFRGDRPVTRYEFAAGLNACLEQILQPLEQNDLATQSEFDATLQRQQQLNQQLNELSDEIDSRDRPSAQPPEVESGS
jgi:hypothetical protein